MLTKSRWGVEESERKSGGVKADEGGAGAEGGGEEEEDHAGAHRRDMRSTDSRLLSLLLEEWNELGWIYSVFDIIARALFSLKSFIKKKMLR